MVSIHAARVSGDKEMKPLQNVTLCFNPRRSWPNTSVQSLFLQIKNQILGLEQFDAAWHAAIDGPQPEWLTQTNATSASVTRIAPDQVCTVVRNTIAVMTGASDKRAEWREAIQGLVQQAQKIDDADTAKFGQSILALLDGQDYDLPVDNAYRLAWQEILDGIAAGGLSQQAQDAAPIMAAIQTFVGAKDWAGAQQVVEDQHEILFRPELEGIFTQNIQQAQSRGEQRFAEMLQQHLNLLRNCKTLSIDAAFAKLQSQTEAALPFEADLIPRSIAALLGSPQDKLAHAQYLNRLEVKDEQVTKLLQAIQMALFGSNLSNQFLKAILALLTGE